MCAQPLTFSKPVDLFIVISLLTCFEFDKTIAQLPLHDEESEVPGNQDPTKCVFGNETFEVGDTWHPTLEIFNRPTYMPCVLCSCYQAEMFGYYFYESDLLPKVKCDHLSGKCPELHCEYPVSDPRKCCKYCPEDEDKNYGKRAEVKETPKKDMQGDGSSKQVAKSSLEVENKFLDLEQNFNYFAAILTGSSLWPRRQTGAVARVYFEHDSGSETVHISVSYKSLSGTATELEVTDPSDTSSPRPLLTHKIDHAIELKPGKICITWKRVEFKTMEKLASGMLYATLKTEVYPEGEIKGAIVKHRALLRESFGSLLAPISDPGLSSGGFVFASLPHGQKNTLDLVIALQGVSDYFLYSTPLEVRLFDSRHNVIGQFEDSIEPASSDNWWEQSLSWDIKDEEHLVRALFSIKVLIGSKGSQQMSLVGSLQPKSTCSSYHCVLAQGSSKLRPQSLSGSVLLTFESNFDINYQVHTSLFEPVTQVAFISAVDKSSEFDLKLDVSYTYFDQWAIGYISAPSIELIQSLVIGELYLQISTPLDPSALVGKLEPLHYSKKFLRKSIPPLLLSGKNLIPEVNTKASGNANVHLDNNCELHFEVFTQGFEKEARLTLEIGQLLSEKLLKPIWSEKFSSQSMIGSVKQPTKEFLEYLNVGQVYVQIESKMHPEGEIRSKISISNACNPSKNSMLGDESVPSKKTDLSEGRSKTQSDQDSLAKNPTSCFFEGRFYANHAEWFPEFDRTCTVCRCSDRAVICGGRYKCEVPSCENPAIPEGECCFTCPESEHGSKKSDKSDAHCTHNGVEYSVGHTWNPVVHPFGVIKCAECTCLGRDHVFCNRTQCPQPKCDHPIKKDPTDCCAVCVEEKPKHSKDLSNTMQGDQGSVVTKAKSSRPCKLGDFLHLDGEKFHPVVPPFGKQFCVECLCTDGKTTCSRTRCDPIDKCPHQFIRTFPDKCCPKCMSLSVEGDKTSYADFVLNT